MELIGCTFCELEVVGCCYSAGGILVMWDKRVVEKVDC
jgi:hypothetical protein